MKGISDAMRKQLDMQLSEKQVREVFEDGKEHELLFLDAIFIDGQSLSTPAHQPMIMSAVANTYEEFTDRFNIMIDGLTKAHRDAVYENLLATRAIALAGMVMAREFMDGPKAVTDAMNKAFDILGSGLALSDRDCLELSMLLPKELSDKFRAYLAETPMPTSDRTDDA